LEGKTVNKTELIDALAARYEGNRKQAAHALESVIDTITREVARGEKVAITGFGSFEKAVRNARWVKNPQTGERMKTKKKSVPKFTPGQDLKNIISGAKKLPRLTAATMPKPPSVRAVATAASAATKKATGSSTAKAPAKKASTSASTAKKTGSSTAKKSSTAAKKSTSTAKKAPAKKASSASSTAKKTGSSATKKAPAKKTAAKTTASGSAAKKAPAKKSTTKKAAAKKS
jgi:DNA-binding protein HU-beta